MAVSATSLVQHETSRFRRFLLYSMFIVLMIDNMPGMGIGFALGLSAKNLYLYALIVFIAIRAVTKPSGVRFVDLDVHVPYLLLLMYATLTWALLSIADPTYGVVRGAITIKNQILDLYLFMFAFRYGVENREDYLWLYRAIIVTMFVSSFVTIIDYLNIPDLGIVGSHQGRIEGPIGAANQYGALLAFLIPVSIAAMPSNMSSMGRFAWNAGIVTSSVLLIASGSRGAFVSVFVGSFLGVIYLRRFLDMRRVVRFASISVLVLIVLMIGFIAFNPEFVMQRFDKTTADSVGTASSGRVDIWRAAVLIMLEWPISFLVGYGWNAYEYSGIWKSAHNEYLDRWFELGIIGVALYVYLLYTMVARVRRRLAELDDEVRQIMIGYVFGMMMIYVDIFFVAIPDPWTVIWLMTGLLMGLQATALQRGGQGNAKTLRRQRLTEAPSQGTQATVRNDHATEGR
jgi:O-antigen ligase